MAKKIDYASLYTLRKDGRYVGSYMDGTKRRYVYDRDPERLWHKLNDPKEPAVITFGMLAESWYDDGQERLRPGTWACYTAAYNRAVALFGDTPATDIYTADIKAHLERLKAQGLGVKTIKTQRTVYSQIFKHAINDEELGKTFRYNPAADAKLPDNMKRPAQRTAPEDDVVNAIREMASTAYFGVFVLTLMSTGFRRGETLALQWKDVDFDNETVKCNKQVIYRGSTKVSVTKTENGEREVPLLPDLAPILKEYMPADAKPDDYIFHGEDAAKPMSESTYRRHWMHYCKEMGFVTDMPEIKTSKQKKRYIVHHYKPTLTAHVMRHGYATMLYDAKVDVYVARKLLGHADIKTTMAIYTHIKQAREMASLTGLKTYVQEAISR